MAQVQGRRFVGTVPTLVGRAWPDVQRELQDYLRRLFSFNADGIPPGFEDVAPTTVDGGAVADAGDEANGWAAADHEHGLDVTGAPGAAASTSAQGAGPGVSLSGHTHAVTWDDANNILANQVFGR